MDFTPTSIQNAISLMSSWEITAALLGVAYVILAAKESLWTWLFGFFSTLIYTVIFWEGALVSSSFLNLYYMVMAGYGYYSWKKGSSEDTELQITSYPLSKNLLIIAIGLLVSLLIGYLSHTYTDAKLAYMDAFVLVFSVIATWLLTQKVIENWLYWLVIDSVATLLYWNTGYLATVMLFMVYIFLGIYAYITWKKEFDALN